MSNPEKDVSFGVSGVLPRVLRSWGLDRERLQPWLVGIGALALMITVIVTTQPYLQHEAYMALSAAHNVESQEASTSHDDDHAAADHQDASSHGGGHDGADSQSHFMELQIALGNRIPLIAVLPFAALLITIAVMPLYNEEWWESNLNKLVVSLSFGSVCFIPLWIWERTLLYHTLEEYLSFIVLLGALFTISGGIFLKGDILGTPRNNTGVIAVGAFLASFIGTTGAAMLLVRPLLRMNSTRQYTTHIFVFLIFLVGNIGGCLTPLGDPPLFLGFLQGVPFFWTFRLIIEWAFTVSILLIVFFCVDLFFFSRESDDSLGEALAEYEPLDIEGAFNFLFLLGIILSVFYPFPFREVNMVFLTAVSFAMTPPRLRKENDFNFHPITEVAFLFIGIFVTMIPALALLRARGGALGLDHPVEYFWFTGILSSFLDNAPTYLNFLSLARGMGFENEVAGVSHEVLTGISLGAVFMGALTYIGNGPNFMIKSIAQRSGVRMPSFGGYMIWSFLLLGPVFGLVTWVFLV